MAAASTFEDALRRRVAALGYPMIDTFDPSSADSLSRMVVWVEDRIIRELVGRVGAE